MVGADDEPEGTAGWRAPDGLQHPPVVRELEVVVEPCRHFRGTAGMRGLFCWIVEPRVGQGASCPDGGRLVSLDVAGDVRRSTVAAITEAKEDIGSPGSPAGDIVGEPSAEDHLDALRPSHRWSPRWRASLSRMWERSASRSDSAQPVAH